MSKRIILHVGTAKTGTTAIQTALLRNEFLLSANALSYPNLTGAGHGWRGERGVSSGNASTLWPHFKWASNDEIKRLSQLLEKVLTLKDEKTPVLSSENLSRLMVRREFWELIDTLQYKSKVHMEIVMYLRDPFPMLISTYQQRVKTGGETGTLDSFIDYFENADEISSFMIHRRLHEILEFANNSSAEFNVLRYEDAGRDIASHFLKLITSNLSLEFDKSNEVNVGLGISEIEFMRGVNSISRKLGRILGWDLTDMHISSRRDVFKDGGKYLLSEQGVERLNSLFEQYFKRSGIYLPFARLIDFEVDRSKTVEALPNNQRIHRARLFDLGATFAMSYKDGYLNWWIEKQKEQSLT
jgi:hypothetical protein